jgi:hypothetical protein
MTEVVKCPYCGLTTWEKVPEVDVWHCNRCGKTGDSATMAGDLEGLRREAAGSYGWRQKGRYLTEDQYAALPDHTEAQQKAKAQWRWSPDAEVVVRLVRAEKAWQPGENQSASRFVKRETSVSA